MQLSKHFTLEELTVSEVAARRGWSNNPPTNLLETLKKTANHMEDVRELLGHAIIALSGYRSIKVNVAVGGSPTSQHCKCEAVDFICPGFGTAKEVAQAIRDSGIEFDQLIYEGTWVHISFSKRNRRQVLTAVFSSHGTTYRNGIV